MSKNIILSEKHGVNSSITVCLICGKEIGIALLGKLKEDEEALRKIIGDLCDECKARVADNKCFIISVGED